MLMLAKNLQNK